MPRQPAAERLVGDLEAFLAAEVGDGPRSPERTESETTGTTLRVVLHPAVDPVTFQVAPGGRFEVEASTAQAGPGYHTWLCHLLRRLGTELDVEWSTPEHEPASVDTTGYFWSDDRAEVERGHLVWLHVVLRQATDPRVRRRGPVHVGAFGGHRFEADAGLVTSLGPRSDSWLAEALERPSQAADVWPWMTDAQDARHLLNRARCLLWTEVRWRAPSNAEERAVLDEVLRLLRRAFPLEPSLPYPWREWREALRMAGPATDPMTERIVREADAVEAAPARPPLIGYRRRPVTVEHAGWVLAVPGSWAERRTVEEWWGGEAGRSVTLAGVETGEGGEPMPPSAFLDRVAGHLGPDALTHQDGPLLGRAGIGVTSDSGIEVATLEGYAAVLGRGAAIRIEIHDPSDWEWAIDTWRSLAPGT